MEFHQTRQGQRYYEHTLPTLIKSINHLTETIEKLGSTEKDENVRTITLDVLFPESEKDNETVEKLIDEMLSKAINDIGGEVLDVKPHN